MAGAAQEQRDVVDGIVASWDTELPGVAGLPLELYKRASRLAVLVDRATDRRLAQLGLSRAEFDILATLRRAPPPRRMTPAELAHGLLLSSGGTSNVVRRLAAAGFVERSHNPEDRRSTWIQLTEAGTAKAEQAVRVTSRASAELLRDVPAETGRRSCDALREVLVALGDVEDPSLLDDPR